MVYVLLALVIALIVVCILLLRKATKLRTNKQWITLFIFEIISTGAAIGLLQYFNNLPGTGFFPGFTYLGEVLLCIIWAAVFFILAVISIIILFVQLVRNK